MLQLTQHSITLQTAMKYNTYYRCCSKEVKDVIHGLSRDNLKYLLFLRMINSMHANILKQSCYVMYFGHSCFWQ